MKLPGFAGCAVVSAVIAAVFASVFAAPASGTPVGSVVCSSTSGEARQSAMAFSAISLIPAGGYTLLIVEATGSAVLSLNQNLQVTSASTLQGQTLIPWNLTAYDNSPLTIASSGDFALDMMVSARSFCQFRGTAIFLQDAEASLFKN